MRRMRTASTPEIDLNFDKGIGWIRGSCAVGRVDPLFNEVLEHMKGILDHDQGVSRVLEIDLLDIPTTLMTPLVNLLDVIEARRVGGIDISVEWHHPASSQYLTDIANEIARRWSKLVRLKPRP